MKLQTLKKKTQKNTVKLFWIFLLAITIITTIGSGILAAIYTLSNQ